jgi:DNA/RNA-binding domain of Phe-tRNA-synthetase-like protein
MTNASHFPRLFIAEEIFARFPNYVRGVVIATGVRNGISPDELVVSLRKEEQVLRQKISLEEIALHPRLESWREAYRQTGVKPNKYRPSIDAMVRRVLQGNEIPSINTLVDIGNLFSLRYILPVGGHAIDVLHNEMALRLAAGSEVFYPFGSDSAEHPDPGEIIFTDGELVMTRRWTWRQANHTLTLQTTTAIEINIDALPPFPIDKVGQICADIAETLKTFCGGEAYFEILSRQNSSIELPVACAGE